MTFLFGKFYQNHLMSFLSSSAAVAVAAAAQRHCQACRSDGQVVVGRVVVPGRLLLALQTGAAGMSILG